MKEWFVTEHGFPRKLLRKLVVGNGGFSLRSKKLTLLCAALSKQKVFKRYHPEDNVIGVHYRDFLEKKGIHYAPVKIAKQFSFEAEDDEHKEWNGQFGFHGFRWTNISKWLKKNPQYKLDIPKNEMNEVKPVHRPFSRQR